MSFQWQRFLCIFLVLTTAAVAVSAQEEEDVDRTDFSDPALSEDAVATGPHGDVEPAWILPDCPDGKVPVGGSTDLLVALANGGSKTFNVSAIEAKLLTPSGKFVAKLPRYEYGQSLGSGEQRSFRYPLQIDAEMALGQYTLIARAYYNTRDKEPFVHVVYNETTELVPPLPDKEAQMRMLQMGLGGVGVLLLLVAAARLLMGSSSASSKSKKAAPAAAAAATPGNEWLAGTLAGTETRSPKKKKKA